MVTLLEIYLRLRDRLMHGGERGQVSSKDMQSIRVLKNFEINLLLGEKQENFKVRLGMRK
jgi:hypothetical protein